MKCQMIILKAVYFGLLLIKRTHNQKLLSVVQKDFQAHHKLSVGCVLIESKGAKPQRLNLPFQDHRDNTDKEGPTYSCLRRVSF